MDPTQKYLKAVEFWLPKDQKQDIVAELSEDIHSEIEEEEAKLGRALTEAETCALLKRRGNPLTVAGKYMPTRFLIGPALFPVYWLLLRSFLLYFLLPWAVLWLCFSAALPAYYGSHAGAALMRTLAPMWGIGLRAIVGLTVAFAILERLRTVLWREDTWEPKTVRVVHDPNRVARSSSIAEVVWNSFVLLWWVNVLGGPSTPGLHIETGISIMRVFYWPVVLLLLSTVLMGVANFLWPVWTRRRAFLRLALDAFALALITGMVILWVRGWNFVSISGADLSPEKIQAAYRWINVSVIITLAIIAVSYAARLLQDGRRMMGAQPLSSRAIRLMTGE